MRARGRTRAVEDPVVGRPNKAQRAAIARRRSDAIDLRLPGVDWLTIARKLAADPAVNTDGVAYPQGYGIEWYQKKQDPPTDQALIYSACRDVRLALEGRRAELSDDVDEMRQLEAERLGQLFFVSYGRPHSGADAGLESQVSRVLAACTSARRSCVSIDHDDDGQPDSSYPKDLLRLTEALNMFKEAAAALRLIKIGTAAGRVGSQRPFGQRE